jgi:Fur family ferric uptake transcriptional regulator/Fur family peroxide stress response transcriptional regulator
MTPQRAAVADVVRSAHDHPTAREIYVRVKRRHPGIGFATVYRTLNLLVEHGDILELQLGDGAVARYDANTALHEHVRCTVCGVIADLHVGLPAGTASKAAQASGFDVDGYALQFSGRCPRCR